jgi:hypothetical protein
VDKAEAAAILEQRLASWQSQSYSMLASRIGHYVASENPGGSGGPYRLLIEASWNGTVGGNIRVVGTIRDPDGQFPLAVAGFVIAPDGSFVHEEKADPLEEICHKLVYLASIAAQERWMVNATKDEYLLPEELLNEALHAVESIRKSYPWAADVIPQHRDVILRFGVILDAEAQKVDEVNTEWKTLVRESRPWAAIRIAARACLDELGFDFATWERRKVNEIPPPA